MEDNKWEDETGVYRDGDKVIILDTPSSTNNNIDSESEYDKIKEEAIRKVKREQMKKQAEEEARKELLESQYVLEDNRESVNRGGESRARTRATSLNDRNLETKVLNITNSIQDEVEDKLVPTIMSEDIDMNSIEANRDENYEKQFNRKWDIYETVAADIIEGERPESWRNKAELLNMLDYIIYVFGFSAVSNEIYKTRTKNVIKEILLSPEKIANYRFAFKDESYDALFALIPKHFKLEYSNEYLKDTFILINLIFKYGEGAMTLDADDLFDIIISKNDILPATLKYNIPYTKEFLIDFSTFGIISAIKAMCVEEEISAQALQLSGMVSETLKVWTESGSRNPQDIKQLTEALSKLTAINKELKPVADETKDAIVFRIPESGLDYSKFLHIVPYSAGEQKDRKFVYYISANSVDNEGKETFVGWVEYGLENRIGNKSIKIFDDEREVTRVYNEISNNPDTPNSIKLTVQRIDVKEFNIKMVEDHNE